MVSGTSAATVAFASYWVKVYQGNYTATYDYIKSIATTSKDTNKINSVVDVFNSAPIPTPIPTPTPTIASKTSKSQPVTIICVKGKLTRNVTNLKPKCPRGFTQKQGKK
jgi:hypothetical protein